MTLAEFKDYLEKETPKNSDGSKMTNEQLCEYQNKLSLLENTGKCGFAPLRVNCSSEDILALGFTPLNKVLNNEK